MVFLAGLDGTLTPPFDLQIMANGISSSSQDFNFTAISWGNGTFTYI